MKSNLGSRPLHMQLISSEYLICSWSPVCLDTDRASLLCFKVNYVHKQYTSHIAAAEPGTEIIVEYFLNYCHTLEDWKHIFFHF